MNVFNANLPSMSNGCAWFAAITHERRIFVMGGIGRGGRLTATAETFDIDTQQWSTIPSMSTECKNCVAVMLGDNIIRMGKGTAEQYSLKSKKWSPFTLMNTRRGDFAAAVVNGKIIVVGGHYGRQHDLASVEEYDPSTGEWREITPMHFKRSGCATAVLDGKLYVMGGCGGYNDCCWGYDILSSVEVYDPTTQQWTLLNDMTTPRYNCAAVSLEGRIVVAGGRSCGHYYLSSCEVYDPKRQKWSPIAPMHSKRQGCTAVEVEGDIYVLGGFGGRYQYLSSMEHLPLSAFFAFLLNDKPALAEELDIDDNSMPAFLSFIGQNCRMLMLWRVIRNRQDLLNLTPVIST